MLDFPRWRIWMLTLLMAFGVLLAIPSVVPSTYTDKLPEFFPSAKINLGLDLAGGSHILLEADTSQLAQTRLESLEDGVRGALRRTEPRVSIENLSRANGQLAFDVTDPSRIDAAREAVLPLIGNSTGGRDWDIEVVNGNRIILSPSQGGDVSALDQAMDTAKDVIDRRINSRYAGTDDHPAGCRPYRGPGPGPSGSGGAEAANRQNRKAGIQTGR